MVRKVNVALRSRLTALLPYAAGVSLVALYSDALRPIWYDEMVFFVLGGLSDPNELLEVILETSWNVNQGQTGTYMGLVYASLKFFGASLISLRLVSMLFALVLVFASIMYLRRQGLSWPWQLLFVILLAGATTLMPFVAEARVYIALAALVVVGLLYYSFSIQERRGVLRIVGWIAVLLLAVMHPYAAVYLPLIIAFGYLTRPSRSEPTTLRGLLAWANVRLVVTSTLLYLLVAAFTWLRGTAGFDRDPWEWLDRPLPAELAFHHLTPFFINVTTGALWLIVIASSLLYLFSRSGRRNLRGTIRHPLLLLALAVAASGVVTVLSLSQGFWILPRQWIASMALSTIAATWFLQRVWQAMEGDSRLLARSFISAVLLIAIASVFQVSQKRLDTWIVSIQNYPIEISPRFSQQDLVAQIRSGRKISDKEWILYSHANTVQGGTVWPEFSRYYLNRDWSGFTVVTDPYQMTIYD